MCFAYLVWLFLKHTMTDKNIVCRNHFARIDKEPIRMTPKNLSKRDLEDLYYKLLYDNKNLKCTVNNQSDKLKVLSTKLLRVTSLQRGYNKNNTYNINMTIEELNDIINDLKEKNSKLTEKVKLLNMKMCSTKQFLKKNSVKCVRCMVNRKIPNNLTTKRSDTVLHLAVSTQCDSDRIDSTRTNETVGYSVAFESPSSKRDEIPEKNEEQDVLLEQAIENAVNKHLNEKENLEKSIKDLNEELIKLKTLCRTYEDENSELRISANLLEAKLAALEAENYNLKTELSLEKKKYSELELNVKSEENTIKLIKIIEDSLSKELQKKTQPLMSFICPECKRNYTPSTDEKVKTKVQDISDSQITFNAIECSTPCKDDSGYAEDKKIDSENCKTLIKVNEELKLKILKLESELNLHKVQNAKQANELLKLMTQQLPQHNVESNVKSLSCDGGTSFPISDKSKGDEVAENSDKQNGRTSLSEKIMSYKNNDDVKIIREKTEKQPMAKKEIIKHHPIIKEVTNFHNRQHISTKSHCKGPFNLKNSEEIHDIVNVTIIQNNRKKDFIPHINKIKNARKKCKSPDNTDYEISSLSNEYPAVKHSSLSAGEDPGVYTYTSFTSHDSSDNTCLSDGELPLRKGTNLSVGERDIRNNKTLHARQFCLKELTADSLEAVKKEIARCKHLLAMDRPNDCP